MCQFNQAKSYIQKYRLRPHDYMEVSMFYLLE